LTKLDELALNMDRDTERHLGALNWPARARLFIGDVELSVAFARLGLQGEIGIVVAGSQEPEFPGEIDRLILDVAANQTAIGLEPPSSSTSTI
jgi:hypothetical protein